MSPLSEFPKHPMLTAIAQQQGAEERAQELAQRLEPGKKARAAHLLAVAQQVKDTFQQSNGE